MAGTISKPPEVGETVKKMRMNLMQRLHGLRAPTTYFIVTEFHLVVEQLLEGSDIQEAQEFKSALPDYPTAEYGL